MEEETRAFLVLIVNTIALILIWMIANVLIGIFFGLAFFKDRPGTWNVVYYVFALTTLLWIMKHLKKKWGL